MFQKHFICYFLCLLKYSLAKKYFKNLDILDTPFFIICIKLDGYAYFKKGQYKIS